MSVPTSTGLVLGFAADRFLGDPRRAHPVAGFGAIAAACERRIYADDRRRGVLYTAALVGGAVALGAVAERASAGRPLAQVALSAAATWAVLGGRSLEREAGAVHVRLDAGELPAARQRLTHLVGRDTTTLDASQIARAVIESVAENTSDAVVAPLVWGAIAGVPGLLGYRAANTLDAMVGHRNARYEHFGWASARLDDLVNLPGSRLSGALAASLGGRPREAIRAWRRDAARHPSPNAGVVESTFAGSLGIRLGGTNTYYSSTGTPRVEHRAVMGDGRPPEAGDIARATRLARSIGAAAVVVCVALRSVAARSSYPLRSSHLHGS